MCGERYGVGGDYKAAGGHYFRAAIPVKMMVGGRIKWYTMALAVQALVRQYRFKDPASSLP